jgi:uncharacterized membrane protein
MIKSHQSPGPFCLELRPNSSANLKGLHIFCAVLGTAFLPVALIFTYLGAWPVLAHVIIVLLFLYVALRLGWRHSLATENIYISSSALVIERCDHRGMKTQQSLIPNWLRVEVLHPGKPGSKIALRSHGKSISIGQCLTPDEHLELAAVINQALRSVRHA